jgi:predicted nucleic acid-binding protein
VDSAIADEWGRVIARREARGRPIGATDALIAATAQIHDLTLVTRNVAAFQATAKSVMNPWT